MYFTLAIFLSVLTAITDAFWLGRLSLIIPYSVIIPGIIIFFWFSANLLIKLKGVERGVWLDRIGFIGLLIVLANAPGSLYLHEFGAQFQYDRFLHIVVPLVLAPLFLIFALLFSKIRQKEFSKKSVLWTIFAVLFIGLFTWEGFQFMLDKIFSTKLFLDYAKPIVVDFWEDIFFGLTGLLLGMAYSSRSYEKIKSEIG